MNNKYQNNEFGTSRLAVPETVSVAMNEIAADMSEGLLAVGIQNDEVPGVLGDLGPDRRSDVGLVDLAGRTTPAARSCVR